MRIAIYHNLPSGGGKRALYEMTKRLARRHEVDAYTLTTAEHDFCDLRPHVARHVVWPFRPLPLVRRPFGRLNQGIRAVDLLRLDVLQRRIAAQIDAAGYDVVFVHNCQYGQSPGLLKFLRTPSVYYCQEPPRQLYEPLIARPYNQLSPYQRFGNLFDPLPGLYYRTLATLDRKNVRSAHLVLVNSAYSRESLYRVYGIFARVCYLGVDTEKFRLLGLPRDHFILSVGALSPRKGFDFLIRSVACLDSSLRPELVLVSNFVIEEEKVYLEGLAACTGVRVSFLTRVSDQALASLYCRARLTAYAPVMEPFGFVPLESMACGTPVVGIREAGVRESIVPDVTGVLTERDPGEYAEALRNLLIDSERACELGQNGAQYVRRKWTWEATAEQVEANLRLAVEFKRDKAI